MELRMKRCNGTFAVRAKAHEFSHVRNAPHDLDELGHNQPRDDGRIEEHTIALDVPHPLPTTVTSGDSPRELVLTSEAFPGSGNDNIHTVALDLPHLLSTNLRPDM